jgi:hypothetical protein
VADRLVLQTLSQEDITAIALGRHRMDAFVRRYIHENFSYRIVILPDGKAARDLEAAIKDGVGLVPEPKIRVQVKIAVATEAEGARVGEDFQVAVCTGVVEQAF